MVLAFGLASSKSRLHPQLNDFHNRNKGKYVYNYNLCIRISIEFGKSNIALVLTTHWVIKVKKLEWRIS